MKKPKISGTETSKQNLTLFRPPPPQIFSFSRSKFHKLSFKLIKNKFARYLFFYGALCVGGPKCIFHHKIMKYDSPGEIFRQMISYSNRKIKKNYIFEKLIIFYLALWRIIRFSWKIAIFAKIKKFDTLFSKISKLLLWTI